MLLPGRNGVQRAVNRHRNHANTERAKKPSLRQGNMCTRLLRPAEREQTNERDRTVAEKIERVCFQRLTFGNEPSNHFG